MEEKSSRMTLVETKANSLSRGKILSPSGKEECEKPNPLKKDS